MTSVMLDPIVPSEATMTSNVVIQSTDHVEISTLSNQGLDTKYKAEAPAPETLTTFSKYAILFKREYIFFYYINNDNFCVNNIFGQSFLKHIYIGLLNQYYLPNNCVCVKRFLMILRNFEMDYFGASNIFDYLWPIFGQRLKSIS